MIVMSPASSPAAALTLVDEKCMVLVKISPADPRVLLWVTFETMYGKLCQVDEKLKAVVVVVVEVVI